MEFPFCTAVLGGQSNICLPISQIVIVYSKNTNSRFIYVHIYIYSYLAHSIDKHNHFSILCLPFYGTASENTSGGAQAEFTNKSVDFYIVVFHVYGVASENTSGATHTEFKKNTDVYFRCKVQSHSASKDNLMTRILSTLFSIAFV